MNNNVGHYPLMKLEMVIVMVCKYGEADNLLCWSLRITAITTTINTKHYEQ
jgi:hypothetical protein